MSTEFLWIKLSHDELPEPIQNVVGELANLLSIGPRQAIRLAFYLVGEKTEDVHNLAVNINNLRKLKICKHCFFPHQNKGDLCEICGNPNRNQGIIMVVKKKPISFPSKTRKNSPAVIL